MNYLTEIKLFYEWLETYPLPSAAITLWHALMFSANRSGWPQEFSASIGLLRLRSNLSRSTIYRERARLREAGRIDYYPQGGAADSKYVIFSLESAVVSPTVSRNASPCGTITDANIAIVSQDASHGGTRPYRLNRVLEEKEKTNKKEKGGEGQKERKSCAKKRETKRLNVERFLASLDEPWRGLMASWLEYKRTKREGYRSEIGVKKCLTMLRNLSSGDPSVAAAIIDQSIANNWAGLFPLRSGAQPQRIGQILQPSSEERERQLLDKFSRK